MSNISTENRTTGLTPGQYNGRSSLYLPTVATIANIADENETVKLFTIRLPDGCRLDHAPGQFVMVSVLGVGEIPIVVTSSPSRTQETFELCIRKVGDVTGIIHRLQVGDQIGIRGPFGRGFPWETFQERDLLFVIGGMGLPPARTLIDQILDHRARFGRLIILYGARTPADFLFHQQVAEWQRRTDIELLMTVDHPDDQWTGNVGVVTRLFEHIQVNPYQTVAVTIGPPIMYRFVIMELMGKGLSPDQIWLSLERRMKCGVGKCGHCQINHRYLCQDGPVLTYAEALALEEAL